MTPEEKAAILTGAESMLTTGVPRPNIPGKNLADGPHGVHPGLLHFLDCQM